MALSEKQSKLLAALAEAERTKQTLDVEQLAQATGYSKASIRTYFTKKLDGVLVFRTDDGWKARGAIRCAPETFARRMSQNAGTASQSLATQSSWQELVRKLLYEGQRRGYVLSREELELVEGLKSPSSTSNQRALF